MKYEIRNYSNYTIDENKTICKKSINGSYSTRVKELENGKGKKYVFLTNNNGVKKRCFVDKIYAVATNAPEIRTKTRKYSNELLQEIIEFKKNHTWKEVEEEYNVNWRSIKARIDSRAKELNFKKNDERKGRLRISKDILQAVIEYKKNHTWKEVEEQFNVSQSTLSKRIAEYESNQRINFFRSLRLKKNGTITAIDTNTESVTISVNTVCGILTKEVSKNFYEVYLKCSKVGDTINYTLQAYYANSEEESKEVLSFKINEISL